MLKRAGLGKRLQSLVLKNLKKKLKIYLSCHTKKYVCGGNVVMSMLLLNNIVLAI